MSVNSVLCGMLALCVALNLTTESAQAFEKGYGTITGQFILEGDIPAPKLLVKKGDPKVQDSDLIDGDIYSEDLVVDKKTKGIANIFVYISPKKGKKGKKLKASAKLKKSKKSFVKFTQKSCRFVPHALIVRTDQTVQVTSEDGCSHNTNASFIKNRGFNKIIGANSKDGFDVDLRVPERYPMPIRCDIHRWMTARWLVLDHPYGALTGKKGKFTISDLPVGDHEFMIYHERAYIIERKFKVTVKEGMNDLGVIKVPVEKFDEDE